MTYRPLALEFVKRKFNFKQVKRQSNVAIYERWKDNHIIHHYEVIIINTSDGYTIKDKDGKDIIIEPAEVYPSDELWGNFGFTCKNMNDALVKFDALMERERNRLAEKERKKREKNI